MRGGLQSQKAFTLSIAVGWLGLTLAFYPLASPASAGQHGLGALPSLQGMIFEVVERISPTVVHIEAWSRDREQTSVKRQGSGLISDVQGHIITNYHIVEGGYQITVTVPGGQSRFPATLVGKDQQTDLAVLKLKTDQPLSNLPFPPFGDSDQVKVGEFVMAVGNPLGLDGTVSFGIVSAKGRDVSTSSLLNPFIQTDALIDQGSSGGPLVNLRGEVVGINSRIQGRGIGFTIPINVVQAVKQEILESGRIERGWLGVTGQPLERDMGKYFRLPDSVRGIVVTSIVDLSPAQQAGLQVGDVITRLGNEAVAAETEQETKQFSRLVARHRIGEQVALQLWRAGRPLTMQVVIGPQPKLEGDEEKTPYGFHVKEITQSDYLKGHLAVREGVMVSFVERGSLADAAKLEIRDVIGSIEGREIGSLADFRRELARVESKKAVLLTVRRDRETRFLLLKLKRTDEGQGQTRRGFSRGGEP